MVPPFLAHRKLLAVDVRTGRFRRGCRAMLVVERGEPCSSGQQTPGTIRLHLEFDVAEEDGPGRAACN